MTSRWRSQAGQGAIEYLGVTVVSAIVVLTIAAAAGALGSSATDAIQRAICQLVGSEGCGATADGEPVVPIDGVVDPNSPRPELAEATDDTRLAVYAGNTETCFASSNGCAGPGDGPDGAIVPPPDPDVCDEGAEVAPDQFLRCDIHGLPILDLDNDGINDFEDPFYTTEDGEEIPWYEQGFTDFNENGVPDADEPDAFSYGINRLYRPGQAGVYCEASPDIDGQLNCAPAPENLGRVIRDNNSSLLDLLERASWFVPIPGGFIARAASKIAGPIIGLAAGKAKSGFDELATALQKLGKKLRPPAGPATTLPDDVVQLTKRHITDSGETVIGHHHIANYPSYAEVARQRGASYFDIGDRWRTLTPTQRTDANRLFLDEIAARGDTVVLSHPRRLIKPGNSSLNDEIAYLRTKKNYEWIDDQTLAPKP